MRGRLIIGVFLKLVLISLPKFGYFLENKISLLPLKREVTNCLILSRKGSEQLVNELFTNFAVFKGFTSLR